MADQRLSQNLARNPVQKVRGGGGPRCFSAGPHKNGYGNLCPDHFCSRHPQGAPLIVKPALYGGIVIPLVSGFSRCWQRLSVPRFLAFAAFIEARTHRRHHSPCQTEWSPLCSRCPVLYSFRAGFWHGNACQKKASLRHAFFVRWWAQFLARKAVPEFGTGKHTAQGISHGEPYHFLTISSLPSSGAVPVFGTDFRSKNGNGS